MRSTLIAVLSVIVVFGPTREAEAHSGVSAELRPQAIEARIRDN